MARIGKRLRAIRENVDRNRTYTVEEAAKIIKENAKAKFDETIEVAVNLGVDPRHADQMVRGVVAQAVKDAKGGSVQFRVEKAGIVHAGVGKASFSEQQIAENVRAFVDAVAKAKPSGAKGTYIKKISVSSTMGPGVRIEPSSVSV